jgi:hypothetical protein
MDLDDLEDDAPPSQAGTTSAWDDDDVEFDRKTAESFYRDGYQTNPERWYRVSAAADVIQFSDVVAMLEGSYGNPISCPFHGTDSKPSFHLYQRSNDGHCFGCPIGEQHYDAVTFVRKKLNVTAFDALKWLEKEFHLSPMADIREENAMGEFEDETPEEVVLTFADLSPAFLQHAAEDLRANPVLELFKDYIETYFSAKPPRNAAPEDEAHMDRAMPLAVVLGEEKVARLLEKKAEL